MMTSREFFKMAFNKLSIELYLMMFAQPDFRNPLVWLALFFVTGLILMIALGLVTGVVFWRQSKRIRRQAAEAGVPDPIPKSTIGFDPNDIEGCGFCIIIVIILIAGALGISLPITLPQSAEVFIMTIVMGVFGALCWGVNIWGIRYTFREYSRREQLLETAIQSQYQQVQQPRPGQVSYCQSCNAPLKDDDKFCSNCGVAT
jgi:NhaP-type Na+/H+ or K+/H+ antiporter